LFTVLSWIMGIAFGTYMFVPWFIEKEVYKGLHAKYPQLPLILAVIFVVMFISLLWLEWSAKRQRAQRLEETNRLNNSELNS